MAESLDDFLAGWLSGAVSLALTQPLDFLTTRLQAASPLPPAAPRALWRGVGPLLTSLPFNNALLFYGYGTGVRAAQSSSSSPSSPSSPEHASLLPVFAGGCAGGAAQSFLQSPVELVKVRLQLARPEARLTARGVAAALLAPSASAFPPLLSKGLGPTLLRDVVPHGVWFATYEAAKRWLAPTPSSPPTPSSSPSLSSNSPSSSSSSSPSPSSAAAAASPPPLPLPQQLAAGALAATLAWIVGYPPDVIKTRVQMEGGAETIGEAARMLYAEGGLSAFYRGLGLKLCRAVPMSAVGFLVYEEAMRALQRLRAA